MERTKIQAILEYMQNGGKVTDMNAVEIAKTYRLSAIIFDLRKRGYNIQDRWLQNENTGNRYKEYWLVR